MSAAKAPAPARGLFVAAGCLAALAVGLIVAGGVAVTYALRLDDAEIAESGASSRPLPQQIYPDTSPTPMRETAAQDSDATILNQDPSPQPETTPVVDSIEPAVAQATPRPRASPEPAEPSRQTPTQPAGVDEPRQETEAEPAQPRGIRGRLQARRERRRQFPLDGTYSCYSGNGRKPVQQFEIDEDTYENLLEEEDGEFEFDLSDNTMTFTDGPFAERFIGVSVRQGQTLKPSSRFRFSGDYGTAADNTIHLVSPNASYSQRSGLGLRCILEE